MTGIAAIAPYALPAEAYAGLDRTGWRVDRRRAVLLVHDMQEYFLRPFRPDAPPMSVVLPNAVRLRQACAELDVPVVYTAQPGSMTPEQRGLLDAFWGAGMSAADEDRRIVDELAPGPNDRVLTKWRYSAFHHTPLLELLRETGRDQLVVCGVYAHLGCLITAVEAFSHGIQPFLVTDAVADFSGEDHRLALTYGARACAATPATKQVLDDLAGEEGAG
ncbi:isochorismatase family protein [Streptomyces sp. FH025]|uniref:isochorismatase family protein n=1 Tax=Streptomyces sp. FH025 TaxID=2815937 RepID=UPI001A9D3CDF|nr:isochorismatase family protein [Streptomyces sp. FH025]MBO1416843.1 isochorismatase family protein [Streptomyces sp. FH025]